MEHGCGRIIMPETTYHKGVCGAFSNEGRINLCKACWTKATAEYPQGWIHAPGDRDSSGRPNGIRFEPPKGSYHEDLNSLTLLAGLLNEVTRMRTIVRDAKDRSIKHNGDAPTNRIYDRVEPAVNRMMDVVLEQLKVLDDKLPD